MSKYTRHINAGEDVEIGGEKFTLKASTDNKVPFLYFQAMKLMKGMDVKGGEEDIDITLILENVEEDIIAAIVQLIKLTFLASYPDEPEEDLNAFVNQNMMELFPIIIGLYSPSKGQSDDRQRAMDKIQQMKKQQPDKDVDSKQHKG